MTSAVAPANTAAAALRESPYVGLVPYSEADADFFFGRKQGAEIIAANLKVSRLTLLYGASGVGKSSVLLAGVVPLLRALAREKVDGRPPFAVAVCRSWRNDPISSLVEQINLAVEEASANKQAERRSRPASLAETVRASMKSVGTVLVVLDQFEDYFLYRAEEHGPGTFAGEFPVLVTDPTLRVNFLISIREDAWAKLDLFEGQIPNLFGNYLRVDHLDEVAARRAIEGPVDQYNRRLPAGEEPYSVEPELVDAILDEVKAGRLALAETGQVEGVAGVAAASGTIETPFLQLVLERLWRATVEDHSRQLCKKTLVRLGGAERIVRAYLADTLGALEPSEQEIASELFRYLVTPSKTKIAHRSADLAFWIGRPETELEPVLQNLSRAEGGRILRPLPPTSGDTGATYEIFHDVLAEPILDWRKQHEQVREKAELAARLKAEQARREKEFRDKLIRWGAVALLAVAAGLAVLASLAVVQRNSASGARELAESRQLAAQAISQMDTDPAVSAELAAKAARIRSTDEAKDALRVALGEIRAVIRTGAIRVDKGVVLPADFSPLPANFSPDGKRLVTAGRDGTARIWDASSGQSLAVLRGHTGSVRAAGFSLDGERVVTASADKTARIWDASSGQSFAVLRGHTGAVLAAGFSRDGERVLTAGADGTARIWDASSGQSLAVLPVPRGHTGGVWVAAAFSPGAKRLAMARDDGKVWLANVSSVRSGTLRGRAGLVWAAVFSPDGRRLVTVGGEGTRGVGTARVWELSSGRNIQVLRDRTGCQPQIAPDPFMSSQSTCPPLFAAGFSPDGKRVVTAGTTARVWDVSSGRRLEVLSGQEGNLRAAAFSPDGTAIVTASGDDGIARVWRTSAEDTSRALRGHTSSVLAAEFSPDGDRVLTVSQDGTARIWDASSGRSLAVLRGHTDEVHTATFSSDGELVVTASADRTARIWDSSSGRSLAVLRGHTGSVYTASFSPDGDRVLTVSQDGTARIWDASSGQSLAVLRGHTGSVKTASFSPDGERVVTASEDGTARIWQTSTGQSRAVLRGHAAGVLGAGFSPDDTRIVTAGDDATTRIWGSSSGQSLAVLRGHTSSVLAAEFSPDGDRVLTVSQDGTARIWDASSGQSLAVLRGHTGSVKTASFSPDGELVVTASEDGTARIWQASNGQSLAVLLGHTGSVYTASFSPDGERVVTAGFDSTARVYSCDICGPLEDLLALAAQVSQ